MAVTALRKRASVSSRIDARQRAVGGVTCAFELLKLPNIHFTADDFSCMPYSLLESLYSGCGSKVQVVVLFIDRSPLNG
jgi:hypothetical protein